MDSLIIPGSVLALLLIFILFSLFYILIAVVLAFAEKERSDDQTLVEILTSNLETTLNGAAVLFLIFSISAMKIGMNAMLPASARLSILGLIVFLLAGSIVLFLLARDIAKKNR